MAALTWPVTAGSFELEAEATVTLPAGTPSAPGVGRHAGADVVFLVLRGTGLELRPPAMASTRRVRLGPEHALDAHGIGQVVELNVLPFATAPILRTLARGVPTFYLGWPDARLPEDDELLRPDEALTDDAALVALGVVFQDEVTTAPWSWLDAFARACGIHRESAAAAGWQVALDRLYGPEHRSLRVVDAQGRPASGHRFELRATRPDDGATDLWTLETGGDGDLEEALRRAQPEGAPASLFDPEARSRLVWLGEDTEDAEDRTAIPVQCWFEPALADAGGQIEPLSGVLTSSSDSFPLLPDLQRGHLQVLDLDRWLAPRPPSSTLQRFHRQSRVEPLVDGLPFYRRLLEDIQLAQDPGGGLDLAGWTFHDFPLDGVPGSDKSLLQIVRRLQDRGRPCRVQINQLASIRDHLLAGLEATALLSLLLLAEAFIDGPPVGVKIPWPESTGALVPFLARVVLDGVLISSDPLQEIEDLSASPDVREPLEAMTPSPSVRCVYPFRLSDNPLWPDFSLIDGLALDRVYDQVGTWHMKVQVVHQPAPLHLAAYVGGIDLKPNRLDTPGHHRRAFNEPAFIGPWTVEPYHDVQARVTGPAAHDLGRLLDERYTFERQIQDGLPAPALTTPPASLLPGQPSRHLVQIGQTAFRSADPVGNSQPLSYAPDGESTIYDTLIRAIRQARRYIYIEDQYFTPNDRPTSGDGADADDVYFDLLLAAAEHCDRLVVLVPQITDQPFGHARRTFLFRRLREAWGDRLALGAPLRRPVLGDPGSVTHKGRLSLLENIGAGDSVLSVAPKARVPVKAPFWLFVNGELMLCNNVLSVPNSDATMQLEVLRTSAGPGADALPSLATRRRRHAAGSAVTLSQVTGINVHAKVMMVDDLFVSIGSANLNRRGFFTDGEANVFALPERLQAAADNPALALRTALWAEHLGLPPAMGASLLRDPVAAFELFARSTWAGNRFADFAGLVSEAGILDDIGLGDGLGGLLLQAAAIPLLNGVDLGLMDEVWNLYSDATSALDPAPHPGPIPD